MISRNTLRKEATRESLALHIRILQLQEELDAALGMENVVPISSKRFYLGGWLMLGGVVTIICAGFTNAIVGFMGIYLGAIGFMLAAGSESMSAGRRWRIKAMLEEIRSMDSPAAVPLLLSMTTRLHDEEINRSAWALMDVFLPRVEEAHSPYFTKASVARLNAFLTPRESKEPLLSRIPVARCLGAVGDEDSVRAMQIARHAQPYLRGRGWEELCAVIDEVLPGLQARLQSARETQSLLRPAQAPDERALLLRPSRESATPPQELLRSASKNDAP